LVDPQQVLRTLRIFEAAGPSLYNVADGGQGVQSSITMAALRAFAELTGGRLFVIADEPEAYLHPLAQHALCSVFEGLAQSDTQVLLTTHSPQFISANYLEGLHKVWMEHRATRVQGFDTNRIRAKQAARLPRPEEREAILAHLSKSLSLEAREGLFAQLVVLCEGETESMSLPLWSELLGSSLAKEGIAVIQAQGKFSIIRLAEFYDSFDIPTYLIFDSDDDEPDSNKRREHARHNRWLLERANSSPTDFPPTTVGASYAVFSPDIESVLRADASYASAEAQVNSSLGLRAGSNKGIRARFVARHFIDRGMPVPSVIRSLIEAILACGESTPARS
jgi:putative ATP-dependent endonuclease of OLD family